MKEVYEKIAEKYTGWDALRAQNIADNLYFGNHPLYGCLEEGEEVDDELRAIYKQVFAWMANED